MFQRPCRGSAGTREPLTCTDSPAAHVTLHTCRVGLGMQACQPPGLGSQPQQFGLSAEGRLVQPKTNSCLVVLDTTGATNGPVPVVMQRGGDCTTPAGQCCSHAAAAAAAQTLATAWCTAASTRAVLGPRAHDHAQDPGWRSAALACVLVGVLVGVGVGGCGGVAGTVVAAWA